MGASDNLMGQPPVSAGLVKTEFIFAAGEAPFAQCHASTVVEAAAPPEGQRSRPLPGPAGSAREPAADARPVGSGQLLAAWFGGTGEGHSDVGIWVSRLEGNRWTAPTEVAKGQESDGTPVPCWNPVLFQPKTGPLLLFYKVGPHPSQWRGMLTTSLDGGRTWNIPRRLPDGILGPIKNKPVELPGGELLCPSSTEDHGWRVHFERTGDLGQTWATIGPVNDGKEFGAIQPSILTYPSGKLQAIGRTRQGKIFQIWSEDGGRSWGPMAATALPNPNSGLDAVTLHDGRQLLVYNHTTRGRSPLNVALSRNGREWQAALELEDQPGEYSYPAVIQTRDRLVHVTYTWKRRSIKHVVLDPARLQLRPMSDGNWPKEPSG